MPMPKYQKAGVRIAPAQGITTAGMQEAARTAQTLTQAMDRVTNFALRQAETQAKIEGQEYGAINAPTTQQLYDAIAAGQDPAELLPGDKTTVFGRSARDMALDSVTYAMEADARATIANMQAAFERGDMSADQLGVQMDSLVKAQSEVMRSINPMAAQKFSASIGVTANSSYLSAVKTEATRNRKDLEVKYRSAIDGLLNEAEGIVRSGNTITADGQIVTIDEKMDLIRDRIAAYAMEIDDPEFYQSKINQLDQAISEAKIGVVMDEAMLHPEAAMRVIRGQGYFRDAEVQTAFDSMDNEDKRELFRQIQTGISTKLSLESALDARNTRDRARASDSIQGDITAAMINGDFENAQIHLERLRMVDPAAYAQKAMTLATSPGIDVPQTITVLRRKSLNNTLTASDIDTAYQMGHMSMSTYKEFTNDLEAQRNQAFNSAVDWLKLDRGLPAGTLLNFSAVQREADREVAEIKKDLILAMQSDPSIDPMQYVRERSAALVSSKGSAADRAKRQQAEALLEQLRVGFKQPALTAQQALDMLESDPNLYPNEQKRKNAMENLLPILIQIEEGQ